MTFNEIEIAMSAWFGNSNHGRSYFWGGQSHKDCEKGQEETTPVSCAWSTTGGTFCLYRNKDKDGNLTESVLYMGKDGVRTVYQSYASDVLEIRRGRLVEDYKKRRTVVTGTIVFKDCEIEVTRKIKWKKEEE